MSDERARSAALNVSPSSSTLGSPFQNGPVLMAARGPATRPQGKGIERAEWRPTPEHGFQPLLRCLADSRS